MIAISACLLGYNCRYNGKNKKNPVILQKFKSEKILPVCPERTGGLSVPRYPSFIVGGDGFDVLDGNAKVVNKNGKDNTKAFIKGAYLVLEQIKANKINRCILKDKSPSCGVGTRAQSRFKTGCSDSANSVTGVTAALLIREGLNIECE